MLVCKFKKNTLSHILVHVFCLHFLRTHHDYFFWRDFECVWAQFLYKQKVVLFAVYLFNYDSRKSTWCCLEYGFCQINYNSSFFEIQIPFFLLSLCVLICTFLIKTWLFSIMVIILIVFWHLYQIHTFTVISRMMFYNVNFILKQLFLW